MYFQFPNSKSNNKCQHSGKLHELKVNLQWEVTYKLFTF